MLKTKAGDVIGGKVELKQLAYSVVHAAQVTDTSKATIYRAFAAGKLDSVRVGGRRLIPREALLRWISGEAA